MIFWESYATIWKVEEKEKYSSVNFSTSRKDRSEEGKYIFSNWSFVSFIGKANEKVRDLDRGARVLLKGTLDNESYINKDGEVAYRKTPKMTVYDLVLQEDGSRGNMDVPPKIVSSDEVDEDFPF